MAKFFGLIGFGPVSSETAPGVWEDVIVAKQYRGDVLRNSRRLEEGDKVNNDISVGNSISIVADAYANQHFFAMKYVDWQGSLWIVSDVLVERPRLILRLGGLYHGDTAPATSHS